LYPLGLPGLIQQVGIDMLGLELDNQKQGQEEAHGDF
jgi:hypothetical protein